MPVRRIAERWLLYYWPLVASSTWIPQSTAKSVGRGTAEPRKFRRSLQALASSSPVAGTDAGLTAWVLQRQADRLTPVQQGLLRAALRDLETAIVQGPVVHAGGAVGGPVFSFGRTTGCVRVPVALGRECSLLGHWIVDAVILRWSELTARFGHREGLTAGAVLPLLLTRGDPGRATDGARQAFRAAGVDRCTWTARNLQGRFDVDHVIPFALWGNNDLWNLVPAHAAVNRQKSDRLPMAALLRNRQSALVEIWRVLRDASPGAVNRQAGAIIGLSLTGSLAGRRRCSRGCARRSSGRRCSVACSGGSRLPSIEGCGQAPIPADGSALQLQAGSRGDEHYICLRSPLVRPLRPLR